jgi:molecular chaperone GrpE (heat shock protein)
MRLVKATVPELTRDAVEKAVREELEVTKNAGMMEESDEFEEISSKLTESIFGWLEGDVTELKEKMDAYRKRLQEAMEAEKSKVIDVAPAGFVNQLGQEKGQKKGKIVF